MPHEVLDQAMRMMGYKLIDTGRVDWIIPKTIDGGKLEIKHVSTSSDDHKLLAASVSSVE